MSNQNSPQKSALENLIFDNQRLRESINEVKKERDEALRNMRRIQAESKALEIRLKTVQAERQKDLNENRRFLQTLDQQKKEKVKLLTEISQIRNALSRKDVEIASIKSQGQSLETQNQRLSKLVQSWNQTQLNVIKEKQANLNSVKLLETKLEASQMEMKFQKNRAIQLEGEVARLKAQLEEITIKYHKRERGVQAIYRDQEATKERLLEEFQNKISDKDFEMKRELQKYLNENAKLKQQVIELKGGLY